MVSRYQTIIAAGLTFRISECARQIERSEDRIRLVGNFLARVHTYAELDLALIFESSTLLC